MPSPEPELRIGRYALLGRVGRGGMGEVHRARAFGAAGVTKELCIKRIRRSRLSDPGALERFVDEARLWMRLSHGSIVPVFDFGRIENDYYLAMEWVDGCDLRRLLDDARERKDPLEDDVVLFVTAAIARALAYLHDASAHEGRAVAHCDLKPSNVLVSRSGEVKLADFGVAVATRSARAGGTRGYIPPSESKEGEVGESADLYALGRVLTELLEHGTSARLHGGERLVAEELAARLLASRDERAEHLVAAGEAVREPTAASVADELEALSARARVRSGRSPRELLMARVARVPVVLEAAETADLETDASFVTEGNNARAFLSHMEARSERSTSSRSPATPGRRGWLGGRAREWSAISSVALLAAFAILWSRSPGSPTPTSDGTTHEASAGSTPRATPRPAPGVGVRAPDPGLPAGAGAVPAGAPLWDRLGTPTTSTDPDPASSGSPGAARSAGAGRVPARGPRAAGDGDAPAEPEEVAEELRAPSGGEAAPAPTVAVPSDDGTVPAAAHAHLRINARPWADVTVDGIARGPTPITDLDLPPGRHEVRLVHPATGRESTTIVELTAGERRDVVVDLRL